MLILLHETGSLIALFYTAIVHASPTDELEERLHQMTLPDPYLPSDGAMYSDDILYYYPVLIEYLKGSVSSLQFEPYLLFGSPYIYQGVRNQKLTPLSPSLVL